MANEEVIVLRGDDGQISTLLNVCRHRGSRVCLEDKGSAKRLSCPYHGWTYRLDGRLTRAPKLGRNDVFDRDRAAPLRPDDRRLRARRRVAGAGRSRRWASSRPRR